MDANIKPNPQMLEDILDQSKKVIAKNTRMNKANEPDRGLIITEIFRYFKGVTRYLEGQFPSLKSDQFHDSVYAQLMKKPYSVQIKEVGLLFEALRVLTRPFDPLPFYQDVPEDILDVRSPI
jgi:hypothetical protein